MANTQGILEAARLGRGTFKSAGASLAGTTDFATLIGTALPDDAKHATFYVLTGPFYINNDGTTADANDLPRAAGESAEYPNSRYQLESQLRFFAPGAYDVRIVLEA